jgi:rod shape-determining protein MreC
MPTRNWGAIRDYGILAVLLLISLTVLLAHDNNVFRTVRSVSLEVTGPIDGVYARAERYTRALQENASLRDETVQLAAEVARLRAARRENERLRALVGFRDTVDTEMVPARVVSKDITRQDNRLTLNVGSRDGVQVGMPVIDERGLVGKIVFASNNYSLVMPHQNTSFAVPAQITELGRDGIVRWDGQQFDRLLMEYVVKTEPVEPGMLVTTSLVSGNYPPGVPIGRVDSAFAAQGRNDLIIYIDPSAPISSVDLVYVVLNPIDEELTELQAVQFGAGRR